MENAYQQHPQHMQEDTVENLRQQVAELTRHISAEKAEKTYWQNACLNAQIKPHFVFNTLNIISRQARLENASKTENLIVALASLLRYSIKTEAKTVPLQREINVINDYMQIQTTRFGEKIKLVWSISPKVDSLTQEIPSFTLQPLVENAVVHGILPSLENGTVKIRIHYITGFLYIKISDTGVGINREKLWNINQNTTVDKCCGIGVSNVTTRLKLLSQYSTVKVYSKPNLATCVVIKIPVQKAD